MITNSAKILRHIKACRTDYRPLITDYRLSNLKLAILRLVELLLRICSVNNKAVGIFFRWQVRTWHH